MGQHGFTHTGRSGEHEVVGTGSRNLDREPGLGLSHDIGEIGKRLVIGGRYRDPFVQSCAAVQPLLHLAQRANTEHLDPVHQAGLGQVGDRNHDGRPALALGGQHRGQHAAHRTDPAVEGQFAEQHRFLQPVPGLLAPGREHRAGQGNVIQRAGLGQGGRRQRQCQP